MEHSALIQQVGAHVLAQALRDLGIEVLDVTVRSWSLAGRSIPAKYWLHIVSICEALGVAVSVDQLASSVAVKRGRSNAAPQHASSQGKSEAISTCAGEAA